jgi:outer membrane biosynthesis protein TonB
VYELVADNARSMQPLRGSAHSWGPKSFATDVRRSRGTIDARTGALKPYFNRETCRWEGILAVTVLDDLRVVEERIAARIAELEPLVQEYNELQQIAERLGIERALAAATPLVAETAPAPTPVPDLPPAAAPVPRAVPAPKAEPKPEPAKPKPAAKAKAVAKPKAAAKPKAPARRKAAAKRTAAKGAAVRRQPGGTQKAGAERRERMLDLIRERSGITVPELSEALEVDAPSLYRVVRKLQSEGTIAKDGKSLRLVAGS